MDLRVLYASLQRRHEILHLRGARNDALLVVDSDPRPGPFFQVQGADYHRQAGPGPAVLF